MNKADREELRGVFGVYLFRLDEISTQLEAMYANVHRLADDIERTRDRLCGEAKPLPVSKKKLYSGCTKCKGSNSCPDAFQEHSHLCNAYDKESEGKDNG